MAKILINMMKCPKCRRWFHGGVTGWVCPYCSEFKEEGDNRPMEETAK